MDSHSEKQLMIFGLSEAFRGGYSRYASSSNIYQDSNKKALVKTITLNPEMITNFFDDLDPYYQHSFMRACHLEGVNLYSVSNAWADRVDNGVAFDNPHDGYRALLTRESIASVAALLKPGFDWSVYFGPMEASIKVANYVNQDWNIPLDMYLKNNESSYKAFLENILFKSNEKPPHDIRGYLYQRFIRAGYLIAKLARKMRSDGSEAASVCALNTLLDSEDIYDNFDELVLSFSDTRYESVVTTMARKIPDRLLPSIMGAAQRFPNSQYALAKRFQEIEESNSE